jgi:nitrate reductase gamma subunit
MWRGRSGSSGWRKRVERRGFDRWRGGKEMITYLFVAFAVILLVNVVSSTVVKIQVNKRLPEDEQFSWWSKSTSGIIKKHGELYPGSSLSDVSQYSGWAAIVFFVLIVLGNVLGI